MPDGIDTSIYRVQPNPLGTLSNVYNIENSAIALQRQEFELRNHQANVLREMAGSMFNTQATPQELESAVLTRARQGGFHPEVVHNFLDELHKNKGDFGRFLQNQRTMAAGTGGLFQTEDVFAPGTAQPVRIPAAQMPAGGVPAAAPPGAPASIGAMQADQLREANFASELVPWQKARELLRKLPEGATGPGTPGRQQLEEFAFALSPTVARWAGVSPDKIRDWGQLQKYLTQATLGQANAIGGRGTDQQLMTTITGNPHATINDLTNRQVIDMAIAVRRMEHAQVGEAAKRAAPTQGANYIEHKNKLPANLEPAAFMIDMMPPEQIQKLQSTLKGEARRRFNQSLRMGIEHSGIIPPGQ